MVEIIKVTTSAQYKKFITFPHHLYKGNPYWCPPIIMDEKNTLSPKKNHAFGYCRAEYWLAYKGGKLVGRVAGILNPNANKRWGEDLVRFGWIDFIDDREVSQKLIDTVSEWGRSQGMKGIHGPLGFTDMDNEGMMVEGFDQHCTLSSIYNYPYYADHMVGMGFGKATDWVQFEFEIPPELPEKFVRTAKIVEDKFHLRVLKAKRRKDLLVYAKKMFAMLNAAFDELYGFAALNEKQMDAYVKQYFGFIRPEFVAFVLDPENNIVVFGVTMPSVTRALQKSNGKFFPFGWINLLKSVYYNDTIDMYLVGVHPDYHGKGAAALVWKYLHEAYRKHGITKAYSNPQLEDNARALSIWKSFDGKQIIRRRCWVKHF